MRTLISSVIGLALSSSAAPALVESKCVTPRGITIGLIQILPDAQADRRRPCVGSQTEYKTEIVAIKPSPRAIQLGLVPEGTVTNYTGTFRYTMGLDIDGEPDDHDPTLAELENGLWAGLRCVISASDEVVLSWVMATNARMEAVGLVGEVTRRLEPFELRPNPSAPDRSWIAHVSTDDSGDDRMTTLPVPDMSIVGADGSEIGVTDARAHLNTDEAFCTAVGTLTVIEPAEPVS